MPDEANYKTDTHHRYQQYQKPLPKGHINTSQVDVIDPY